MNLNFTVDTWLFWWQAIFCECFFLSLSLPLRVCIRVCPFYLQKSPLIVRLQWNAMLSTKVWLSDFELTHMLLPNWISFNNFNRYYSNNNNHSEETVWNWIVVWILSKLVSTLEKRATHGNSIQCVRSVCWLCIIICIPRLGIIESQNGKTLWWSLATVFV